MNKQTVIEFIAQNPVCTIATIEGDQPRARGFLTNLIDGELYFTTGRSKQVYAQLAANPKVELCYFAPDFSKMLRLSAVIHFEDDRVIKQRLIDLRDYLKGFKADDPDFILLRPAQIKARFWTLADNMNEASLPVAAW